MKALQLAPVAAMAVATATLPAGAETVAKQVGAERCIAQLTKLPGAELGAILVGRHITLSPDPGVCPGGLRITDPWYLELQAGGHFVLGLDRGLRSGGSYTLRDDQLCVGKGADPAPCATFYRDDAGRVYMFGRPNPNSVPTVLGGVALPGN